MSAPHESSPAQPAQNRAGAFASLSEARACRCWEVDDRPWYSRPLRALDRLLRKWCLAAGLTLGAGIAALGGAAAAGEPAPSPVAAVKPNVVIILTDDQGYQDLGCFGSPNIKTPNIDRMAAEGMRFTQYYCGAAVCSPARAALMTGCYAKRVGIPAVLFRYSKHGLNPDEFTIGDAARTAGYATACIGKWHLGHRKETLPTNNGFDYYYGLPYSNDMNRIRDLGYKSNAAGLDKAWREVEKSCRGYEVPLMRNTEVLDPKPDQRKLTSSYTEEAVKFITENKGRPFLLYVAHSMPHVPLFVPDDRYDPDPKKAYKLVVEHIDFSTGRIVEAIKAAGIEKKTLVIFTSDNGPWLSKKHHGGSAKPLSGGKGQSLEGGMRVPCVMWAPGLVPAGKECHEPVTAMDILPTFAEMTGVKLPADRTIDGRSILPLVKGEEGAKSPHEAIYYYVGDQVKAIRMGKWKLDNANKGVERAKLCDITTPQGERTSLDKTKHAEIVARLYARMKKFDEDLTANSRKPHVVAGK